MKTVSAFQYYDGRCPYCKSPSISIVEGEVVECLIDKNGYPTRMKSREYTVAGFCNNCSKAVYIEPNGMGFIALPYDTSYIDFVANMYSILGNKAIPEYRRIDESLEEVDSFTNDSPKEGELAYNETDIKLS